MAILSALALDTPAAPQELNPLVPANLSSVVMRLLEKEPDRRLASAAEVAAALADIEQGLGPRAVDTASRSKPPSTMIASTGPRRGRRLRVLALFLGVLILIIPLSWFGWNAWRDAPSVLPVAPPGPRKFSLAFEGNGKVILPIQYDWSHPLTIEAWFAVKKFAGGGHQNIIADGPAGGFHLGIANSTGSLDCLIHTKNGPAIFVSDTPLQPGQAHHVAMVLTPDAARLYQDGKLVAETNLQGPRPSISPIMLANTSGKEEGGLRGQLFDVRFSKSLRYQKDFIPSPRLERDADTWALYSCDEGKGAKLGDASDNGHHGDIIGGAWQAF